MLHLTEHATDMYVYCDRLRKGKEEAMRDKLQHLLQDGLEDDIASEEK